MKLSSIKGEGHSLTLVKGHSDFKVKTCFFAETVGQFGTKAQSLRENGNENIYK